MNRVTKIYSIVAGGWWHAIGARKAAAAAGRPQMTIELKSKVWESEGTSLSYDRNHGRVIYL